MADETARVRDDLFLKLFGDMDCTATSHDEQQDGQERQHEISGEQVSQHQMEEEEEEQHELPQTQQDEDPKYVFGVDSVMDEILEHGPRSGMLFQSEKDLVESYRAYAKSKGFGIAIRNRSGRSKYLNIRCEKARDPEGKKFSKRVGCEARINAIHQGDDVWLLGKVFNDHNHELEPEMSEFMPAHRQLSTTLKRELEAHDRAGQRLSKTIRYMEILAGGPSNLGATVKDCRNYVEERRRLRLGAGDAAAILKFFKSCQKNDKNFFYLVDIDDESRLRNVMWIHPRSRAAYEDFHDVVSFDTTYLVNQ